MSSAPARPRGSPPSSPAPCSACSQHPGTHRSPMPRRPSSISSTGSPITTQNQPPPHDNRSATTSQNFHHVSPGWNLDQHDAGSAVALRSGQIAVYCRPADIFVDVPAQITDIWVQHIIFRVPGDDGRKPLGCNRCDNCDHPNAYTPSGDSGVGRWKACLNSAYWSANTCTVVL